MYGIREVWRLSRFGVGIVEFLIELGLMSNRRNFSLSLSLSMFAKVHNSRGNISIPLKVSCSRTRKMVLFLSLCSQEHIIREETFLPFPLSFHFFFFKSSKVSCSGNIGWKNGTFFLFLSLSLYARKNI